MVYVFLPKVAAVAWEVSPYAGDKSITRPVCTYDNDTRRGTFFPQRHRRRFVNGFISPIAYPFAPQPRRLPAVSIRRRRIFRRLYTTHAHGAPLRGIILHIYTHTRALTVVIKRLWQSTDRPNTVGAW